MTTSMPSGEPVERLSFQLDGSRITLGRDDSCRLRLSGLGVSRRHAEIVLDKENCRITDLGSTFGLRVNGEPAAARRLAAGDVLTLGVAEYKVDFRDNALVLSPAPARPAAAGGAAAGRAGAALRIGRAAAADLILPHPLVSNSHASALLRPDGDFLLTDLHSTNGTFVNGRAVKTRIVSEGDIIQIGPYRLFVEQGKIVKADDGNRIRLEAFGLTVKVKNTLLLDRVTLCIPAGEFVAVLGVSGAGKSTLGRALSGRQRITAGAVYANRLPLQQFLNAFTTNIGYVSQDNLLHRELTVYETFDEQCLLRLPRDSSAVERRGRIAEVIDLLELDKVKERRISRLSGGEAKRVHLGVELLASPALIVLDEPLAGLDPGLVRRFMKLFRRIADRGHTVLLTTHTLEQIEFCDRLVFMHAGRIVFCGQPSELGSAFGRRSLPDVYEQIIEGTAARPQQPPAPDSGGAGPQTPAIRQRKPRTVSFFRQFGLLFGRYTTILRRDHRNLALMLLQAPAIALFLSFVFRSDAKFLPLSFYFCLTISAIWLSGINAAQEIAREWRMLDREWRAGLSLAAYLSAKIGVTVLYALLQATLFWIFLRINFAHFQCTLETLGLIAAGTVSGGILGLCVSACSGRAGRAITALPMIFIPQIFFSGILIPFDRMTDIGRWLSFCTLGRPVFTLFKQTCLLDQPIFSSDAWLPLCILCTVLIILMSAAVRLHCKRQ